jgi:lysyl-tRNA synthetase class 2
MSDLRQQRLDKLQKIKDLGINPYPQPNLANKNTCQEALESLEKKVTLAGRVMSLRGHGKILFADLVDRTGKIQLFFQAKNLDKNDLNRCKLLDIGDIISLSGKVFKTQAGEITVDVTEFQILAKNLRPLPEKWHGLKDIEDRYRQRYVDLIVNPEVREIFLTRSKILSEMRKFLDDHGFIEVETPILQPIYGGASAKPFVTHHNNLDMDMYLRISDELYLKRLIVGGFEKVYEVSKDFRNEGVSRFHNPEFTQIEFYWAYVDYEELMSFTQKLVSHVIKSIKKSNKITYQGQKLDFTPPFKKLTFRDAIKNKLDIDIDEIKTEDEFKQIIQQKKIKVDLSEVIGLGAHFDALYKEHVRPYIIDPTFVTDYPSEMIALAKRKEDNPQKIASFQLLACGAEMLKAYNELNDPQDQYDRWLDEEKLAQKGDESAMKLDADYIRALEYGMPPTAGWGMGIDRLTQFITDQPTIKDVILFPAMRLEEIKLENNQSEDKLKNEIVLAKVVETQKHENSDHLFIIQVTTDNQNQIQIVTAADNLKDGDLVALALPGSTVTKPGVGELLIKSVKMRGVDSAGMLCSGVELGVNKDHTKIHVFSKKVENKLGLPISKIIK